MVPWLQTLEENIAHQEGETLNEIITIKVTYNSNKEENGASKEINVATWELSDEPKV